MLGAWKIAQRRGNRVGDGARRAEVLNLNGMFAFNKKSVSVSGMKGAERGFLPSTTRLLNI